MDTPTTKLTSALSQTNKIPISLIRQIVFLAKTTSLNLFKDIAFNKIKNDAIFRLATDIVMNQIIPFITHSSSNDDALATTQGNTIRAVANNGLIEYFKGSLKSDKTKGRRLTGITLKTQQELGKFVNDLVSHKSSQYFNTVYMRAMEELQYLYELPHPTEFDIKLISEKEQFLNNINNQYTTYIDELHTQLKMAIQAPYRDEFIKVMKRITEANAIDAVKIFEKPYVGDDYTVKHVLIDTLLYMSKKSPLAYMNFMNKFYYPNIELATIMLYCIKITEKTSDFNKNLLIVYNMGQEFAPLMDTARKIHYGTPLITKIFKGLSYLFTANVGYTAINKYITPIYNYLKNGFDYIENSNNDIDKNLKINEMNKYAQKVENIDSTTSDESIKQLLFIPIDTPQEPKKEDDKPDDTKTDDTKPDSIKQTDTDKIESEIKNEALIPHTPLPIKTDALIPNNEKPMPYNFLKDIMDRMGVYPPTNINKNNNNKNNINQDNLIYKTPTPLNYALPAPTSVGSASSEQFSQLDRAPQIFYGNYPENEILAKRKLMQVFLS
jgi:hypothetical protein